MLGYLTLGAGYGFAAAVQPGPLQAYLVSRTLRHGWRRTLPALLAPLLTDGPIIVLVLVVLSRLPAWWLQGLRFAGGAFILYLAWGVLRTCLRPVGQGSGEPAGKRSLREAVLINLLNPNPYLFWSLVTGPILLKGWRESPAAGLGFLGAFYLTMLACMAGLLLVWAMAGSMGPRMTRALLGLSGLVLAGFGLWQVWSGVAIPLGGG
jgi:threonine/homoserine/homoserine lactone efflux protein